MRKINAQFEITSPMFLAGHSCELPNGGLTIRPPAIKGALRFWWRALVYPALHHKKSGRTKEALAALHLAESVLFGNAASDKTKSGQSLVLLRVLDNAKPEDSIKPDADKAQGDALSNINYAGCHYLLGQGLFRNSLSRAYIKTNTKFSLQLVFKPAVSPEQVTEVKNALLAFGLLGALGSRARKGFGSVQLLSWDETVADKQTSLPVPQTKEEYKTAVAQLFNQGHLLKELPPFSAFSAYAMADISLTDTSAVDALNHLGQKQQLYRGYGENSSGAHLVNKKAALQLFSDDHDSMYNFVQDEKTTPSQPRRLVFGLPHTVWFSSLNAKVKVELAEPTKTRRASPLFVHIQRFGEEFAAIQFLLAAQFFPSDAKLKFNKTLSSPTAVEWAVINDYLTLPEYKGANHQAEGFTTREAIFQGSLR